MIARIWRGAVRVDDAAAYARYIQETGIEGYKNTPGNRGAWALWRADGDQAEFEAMVLIAEHIVSRMPSGSLHWWSVTLWGASAAIANTVESMAL